LENKLHDLANKAYYEKHRVVAPLVGFPGVKLTGSTIKLAQQNYGEHLKVLNAIAEKFKPDVIFPLMDLSVEANALGRYTMFPKEESATVVKDEFCLDDLIQIEQINISYDSRLLCYVRTLELMRKEISPEIIKGAYVTGPYTLAALLIGAEEAAIATLQNQDYLNKICELTTKKIQDYVQLLINAGAQLICILEPSGVMLGPEQFKLFSAKYVQSITNHCRNSGVITIYHVCGNSMHLVEKMSMSGVDALSLDSEEAGVNLSEVAEKISQDIVIIGNISPIGSLLKGKPENVHKDVNELLKSMEPYSNFILSTGCDLPLETPIENIYAFMDAGKNYKMNL